MSNPRTLNLIAKGRTRRREVVPGDLFTLNVIGVGYLYGLVACADVWIGSLGPLHIVYVYDAVSPTRTPVPHLRRDGLVIPPQATNPTPWRSGKWEYLETIQLSDTRTFSRHCFYSPFFKKHYDHRSHEIAAPFEPCLLHAMSNVTSIEYDIGRKLGLIPLDDQL